MKFRELVKKYKYIKARIKQLDIEQSEIKEVYCQPKSNTYEQHFGTHCTSSLTEFYIAKLNELENTQNQLKKTLDCLRLDITNCLDKLENYTAREVVEYRIFTNFSWKYIADQLNYSSRRVQQLYDLAFKVLKNVEI